VAETKRYKGAAALAVMFTFIWPLIVNSFGGQRSIASPNDDLRTVAVEWTLVAIRMLGLLVVMYALIGLVSRLVAHPKFDLQQLAAIPFGIRLMLPITAGVCEEFMFRGFAIEEIGMLTGSRWPGAALSVVFFGLGHVGTYGFSSAVFLPMTIGLVITVLYMWRNNLPLCMLMHTVIDSVSLLLVPALTKH
jgi:membrane protease YdiL (CAAX protease family)